LKKKLQQIIALVCNVRNSSSINVQNSVSVYLLSTWQHHIIMLLEILWDKIMG